MALTIREFVKNSLREFYKRLKLKFDSLYASKQQVEDNAYVTSAALNDLNDRLETVESSLEDYVTAEDYSVIEEVVRDNYTKQEADVKFATLDDINGLMSAIASALNASCAITESPGGNRTYTFTLNQG